MIYSSELIWCFRSVIWRGGYSWNVHLRVLSCFYLCSCTSWSSIELVLHCAGLNYGKLIVNVKSFINSQFQLHMKRIVDNLNLEPTSTFNFKFTVEFLSSGIPYTYNKFKIKYPKLRNKSAMAKHCWQPQLETSTLNLKQTTSILNFRLQLAVKGGWTEDKGVTPLRIKECIFYPNNRITTIKSEKKNSHSRPQCQRLTQLTRRGSKTKAKTTTLHTHSTLTPHSLHTHSTLHRS